MTVIPTDSPAATPRLSRSPFVRRMAVCLIAVLMMLGLRWIWGRYTAELVRTRVAELRARGEPIEAADFAFIEVPDAHNAAKYQQDAARAANLGANPPRATSMSYPAVPPYNDAWMAAAEASEQAHGKLFALAREARRHTRVQWNPKPFTAPLGLTAPMAAFNGSRHLANVLADGAELAHVRGDDPEAIERVRDILHLARSLRHDDTMLGQLVGAGVDAMACNVTLTIAPGLRLDPASGATSAPATRAAAQALIAELLDEELLRRGMARSFRFERAVMHETRQTDGAGTWVIRPLTHAQLVRELRNLEVYIEAASLANRPQVAAALARTTDERPDGSDGARGVPRYSRWFGQAQYYDRYFTTMFRVIGERRMAAASLAAQLFRADHGRWPQRLEELVPRYLPSVPLDPFADGKPLGYVVQRGALPDGRDRPLVFHTGGELDAGPYPEPSYSWEGDRRAGVTVRKDLWQYRDLARFVPATQPASTQSSTQAVDDQP